jgi:hypothetical protein
MHLQDKLLTLVRLDELPLYRYLVLTVAYMLFVFFVRKVLILGITSKSSKKRVGGGYPAWGVPKTAPSLS